MNQGSIFVFGSNEAGAHGGGAALAALRKHGAVMHVGRGPMGSSYAIPTLDHLLKQLPIHTITRNVNHFLWYARQHASLEFQVTRIGCGIAGFSDDEIAPMFRESSANCFFDLAWKPFLGEAHNYWGTY